MSKPTKKREIILFPTVDIVAASAIAYRKNSTTVVPSNLVVRGDSGFTTTLTSNRLLVKEILTSSPSVIKQEDRDEALAIIRHIQGTVTIRLLTGNSVSPFMQEMARVIENEKNEEHKFGILVYAPQIYSATKQREESNERISDVLHVSKGIGNVGEKITINFSLIKSQFVQSINCFSVVGTDEHNNLVQFLTNKKELCQSQQLSGKIKSVGQSQYHNNAIVNCLSYVKAHKK